MDNHPMAPPFSGKTACLRAILAFTFLFCVLATVSIVCCQVTYWPATRVVVPLTLLLGLTCDRQLIWCFGPVVQWYNHRRRKYVYLSFGWLLERKGKVWELHQTISPVLAKGSEDDWRVTTALREMRAISGSAALGNYDAIVIPSGFLREKHLKKLGALTRRSTWQTMIRDRVGRWLLRKELAQRRKITGQKGVARFDEEFRWEGWFQR